MLSINILTHCCIQSYVTTLKPSSFFAGVYGSIQENRCKEYNSEVNLHDPHLSCLGHSQACWRDFTFRLAGFKEGEP